MRNYLYNIIATIIFMAGFASAKAQTLNAVVSWDESVSYTPVCVNNIWHIVNGTQITITLEATIPTSTQEKVYENNIVYRKGETNLSNNIDTFTPTSGVINYTAVFHYKLYTQNAETLEWETDDVLHEEESEMKVFTINMLPAPSITINSLTTSAPSTYNGGPHITATLNCTTNAAVVEGYTEKIEWREGSSGSYSEGSKTYDFNPTGKTNTTIFCKVSIIGPDGKVWGTTQERNVTVNVLPTPSITINSLTTSAPSTYNGGPHITATLNCTTNAAVVEGYTEKIEWREGSSGSYSEGSKTYDFNPTGKTNTTIFCKVSIIGPDGKVWGTTQERNVTVNVYSTPKYTSIGMHNNKADDTTHEFEYSTYKNTIFDASKLFSCEGGNPDGWQYELYVAGEKMTGLTFTPNEIGDYTIRLIVKNVSPFNNTEIWYKNSDDGNGLEYTLHVYDKATWTTNISDLFADVSDAGMYKNITNLVRHIESGNNIPFEVDVQDGDVTKMETKMTIGNVVVTFSTSDLKHYFYNFQKTNDSDKEEEYNFGIHISYNIDYLIEGQELLSKEISGKIVVWKDIYAHVANLPTDITGNYILETSEDNGNQKININLTGGNPEKWLISPDNDNGNSPIGAETLYGHDYTYTLNNDDLKSNNDEATYYKYSFTLQYVDGQTKTETVTKNVYIKVWPKPVISSLLTLYKNGTVITYNRKDTPSQDKTRYTVDCYDGDEFVLTVVPSGGNMETVDEDWEYVMTGQSERQKLPVDHKFNIAHDKSGLYTITFYNRLRTDKVLSVEINIIRHPQPDINTTLPSVDNTNSKDWNEAEEVDGSFLAPVHLYGDGTQTVSFMLKPKSGNEGYLNGWTYSCNQGNIEQSTANAQWDYNVKTTTSSSYEDQIISISIKNSIPANENQNGENLGFQTTKNYHLRVWHKTIFPSDYSLTDNNNLTNDIKSTHAIREGNTLKGHIDPMEYGYNPDGTGSYYDYSWEGQGSANQCDWEKENISNSNTGNSLGRTLETYKLSLRNKGPRGTVWVEKTYNNCDVYIYNRPETPKKLEQKGNGTSGTMIIEYDDISDEALLASGDYVIDFYYTDANKDYKIIAKSQTEVGDIRWATGYTNASQMDNAFVYTHWLDAENGVLITSGKRTINGIDESWDSSMYNLTPDKISSIRALTRAGNGNYTAIGTIQADDIDCSDISIYNIKGLKVGDSTKGLSPGIYIIRYKQNGIYNSRKLFVR